MLLPTLRDDRKPARPALSHSVEAVVSVGSGVAIPEQSMYVVVESNEGKE